MDVTAIPEGLEPLGAWDARDGDWPRGPWRERAEWVDEHLGRATDTYRAEFYLFDEPFVVVYRYAVDEDGRKFTTDPQTCEPETEEPVVQMPGELPPAHLLPGR